MPSAAVGRVSAEMVCPYPPGVPVLYPGAEVTAEVARHLQAVLAAGGTVVGCVDESLATLHNGCQPCGARPLAMIACP